MTYDNRNASGGNRGNNGNRNNRPGGGRNGTSQRGGEARPQKKFYNPLKDKATAPYNFVPLPLVALPSPLMEESCEGEKEKYISYVKSQGALSGVIDLELETKTPSYIGGGERGNFFAPTDRGPVIPGSTLRGMVKNIMKILTCGAMRPSSHQDMDSDEIKGDGDFFDHNLYFRTMAAKKGIGIKNVYDSELMHKNENGLEESKAEAGFLLRIGREYWICPTEFKIVKDPSMVKNRSIPNSPKAAGNKNCIDWNGNYQGQPALLCFTGAMMKKVRYTVHLMPGDWKTGLLEVPNHCIIDYKDDTTRRGIDLFKVGKKDSGAAAFTHRDDVSYVVPCFYVAEGGIVRHFGFSRHYRVPYQYRIAQHIPKELRTDVPDFTDAIFGRKESWGSRLAFGDCVCEKDTVKPLTTDKTRILSSPNPTAFQLYLSQGKETGERNHWNSLGANGKPVPICGYKLYWHQQDSETAWRHRQDEPEMKDTKPITPIASGAIFHGRIRFDRLSPLELGALLSVFYLSTQNEEVCFKLGHGKSIGMGSVRITATPKLIEQDSYTKLFTEDGSWNKSERRLESSEIKAYTDAFSAYIEKELKRQGGERAYARYQISQRTLIAMLDWRKVDKNVFPRWKKETCLMQETRDRNGKLTVDDRFKERLMLPDALTVIERARATTP